jgi:Glycosyltransferase Family 4
VEICILTWRDMSHPAAGGAEVYTEEVATRWAAAGHDVTLIAASVPGRPAEEWVDGYLVLRMGGKYTVYREARRWWRATGHQQHFTLVLDMINTLAFRAHQWIDDVPTVGFAHQTCEEIWHINAPFPADLLGRYVLEPRWLRAYAAVPTLAVSDSTKQALQRFGVRDVTVVPEGFDPPARPHPGLLWSSRADRARRRQRSAFPEPPPH